MNGKNLPEPTPLKKRADIDALNLWVYLRVLIIMYLSFNIAVFMMVTLCQSSHMNGQKNACCSRCRAQSYSTLITASGITTAQFYFKVLLVSRSTGYSQYSVAHILILCQCRVWFLHFDPVWTTITSKAEEPIEYQWGLVCVSSTYRGLTLLTLLLSFSTSCVVSPVYYNAYMNFLREY